MAWFEAFRNDYGFSMYSDNRRPVTHDIPILTVTYLCVLVSVATLIATLGIRGRERWSFTLRAIYAVAIGSIILACLVGYGWQEGSIKIKSMYIYRNNLPFEGYIGIRVGLNAVNVTLDGYYSSSSGPGYVFYAESMPSDSFHHESQGYNFFLRKGLPEPILRVMEFLTVDEGGFRWGRSFESSGHYAMALLWTSFAFWIVSNVLLCSVIVYGAYMFALTGLTMVLACVSYHVCQCPLPLTISFGDQILTVSYSWSFWLTLAAGCLTFTTGMILIITDHFFHTYLIDFFHLEKLIDEDAYENEYRQENCNVLLKDRRGTIVPPAVDRRGSIFLDPCRQPASLADTIAASFLNGNAVFTMKSSDKVDVNSKVNPVYSDDNMASSIDGREEDVTLQMERVCQDCELCMSTKKPSLATLKEHRENHVNERIYSSANTPTSRYFRKIQHLRKVNYQESIFSTGSSANLNNVSCASPRRESCPSIIYKPVYEEESIQESPDEYEPDETVNKSLPTHEILICVEPEHTTNKDSCNIGTVSLEPTYAYAEETINCSENESGIQTRNNSESSCSCDSSVVIVNLS